VNFTEPFSLLLFALKKASEGDEADRKDADHEEGAEPDDEDELAGAYEAVPVSLSIVGIPRFYCRGNTTPRPVLG
jgi:hypothetical protein